MCGKSSTNTSTQTTTPAVGALAAYTDVVGKAQKAASTPYQPYTGQLVAGLNSGQQSAIGQLQSIYGMANPYFNAGSGLISNAASGLGNTSNYLQGGAQAAQAAMGYQQQAAGLANPNAIAQYMNPYTQSVIDTTMKQAQQNDAVQQQSLGSSAIGQGSYGGDRSGIAAATLAGQQAMANNQTVAGLNAQNYSQAQAARQTDAGIYGNLANSATQVGGLYGSLGNAQTGAAQAMGQLGSLSGQLGTQAQNAAIQGASAGLQGSTLQQQNEQAQDTALYGQYQQGQAYPFQTLGWLSNIVQGIGSDYGKSVATTTPAASTLSQLAGAATTGVGLLGSTGAFGTGSSGGWLYNLLSGNALGGGFATGGRVEGYRRGGLVPVRPDAIDLDRGNDGVYRAHFADGGAADFGIDDPIGTLPGLAPVDASAAIPTQGLNFAPTGLTTASPLPATAGLVGRPMQSQGLGVVDAPPQPTQAPQGLASGSSGMGQPSGLASSTSGASGQSGGMSKNAYLGIMAAGLGMMAGTSPQAGNNIGAGGLAGMQMFNNLNNADRESAATQSDIAYRQGTLGLERQKVDFDESLVKRRIDNAQRIAGGLIGAPAAQPQSAGTGLVAPAPGGLAGGSQSAPTSGGLVPAPATGETGPSTTDAPSGGNAWAGVPDQMNPLALSRRAASYQSIGDQFYAAGDPDQAKTFYDQANSARTLADKITTQGNVLSNGAVTPIPGSIETSAARKYSDTSAEKAAAANYSFREVQPVPGGPTMLVRESQLAGIQSRNPDAVPINPGAGSPPGSAMDAIAQANPTIAKQPAFINAQQEEIAKGDAAMSDQFKTRQLSLQRLQALNAIQQRFQAGTWAEDKANLVGMARSAGFDVKDSDTADPAAFQEFTKNATANIFNDAKNVGGRVLVSELEGLKQANANPNLQPEANAAIIGQGIGLIKYEDQHYQDYMTWRQDHPYATATSIANQFEIPWQKDNPVQQYVNQAAKDVTAKGIAVPPAEKRVNGQLYMTPKGPARWLGTGWKLGG